MSVCTRGANNFMTGGGVGGSISLGIRFENG